MIDVEKKAMKSWIMVSVLLLGLLCVHHPEAQETEGTNTPEAPDQIVQFYKDFLNLYMENDVRIQRLTAMREADAEQDAGELKEEIQERTGGQLQQLAKTARSAEWSHRTSVVESMNKLVRLYENYIQKVVSNWEPEEDDVRWMRRLSESEIIRERPELASPSLLRRAFLGELLSGFSVVPGIQDWLEGKIRRVQDWIGTKYDELFRTFVDLFSRVSRIVNDEDADDEERQRVIRNVRDEWAQFWGDVEGDNKWQEIRNQSNRLLSLFRDSSDRLPGAQDHWNQMIKDLKRQIGHLKGLQVKKPFMNEERRLIMLVKLSQAFAKRVRALEKGPTISISRMATTFVSDMNSRTPEDYWTVQNKEQLQRKKQRLVQNLERIFGELNKIGMGNFVDGYKEVPEQYKFPVDDIQNISKRLSAFYGDKEKEIGQKMLRLSRYVKARYELATTGISFMETYRNALQEQNHESPSGFIQFEQAFREQHLQQLQSLKQHVDLLNEIDQDLDSMIESIIQLQPDRLATAYFSESNKSNSAEGSNSQE